MAEEITEPTLTLDELLKFFEERTPVLNITSIGNEAGLGQGYLNKIIKGDRGLTQTSVTKLLPVLCKHGYQMPDMPTPTTLTLAQLQQFLSERKHTISITFLAEATGLSRSHFHKILAGERSFTQKTALKLLPILPKYGYQE